MSLWLLDTDHTSLFLIGVPAVRDRILQRSNDVAISIVTVQESLDLLLHKID
jgi:predicted nucleic acid-binding protein